MRDASKKRRPTPEQAFGRVLREVRESRDLSQEALGFESGYHRTYIGLLERGKKSPSLRTVFRLSRVLETSPSDLLRRVEALVS